MRDSSEKPVLRKGAPLVNEINAYEVIQDCSAPKPKQNPIVSLMGAAGQFHLGRRTAFEILPPGSSHELSDFQNIIFDALRDTSLFLDQSNGK